MGTELVKPIVPRIYDTKALRRTIETEFEAEGKHQVREFKKTVSSWEGEKPNFTYEFEVTHTDATLLVGPTGSKHAVQKWVWTDQGTRPHTIRAKRAPLLRFQSGFRAKTTPYKFMSSRGWRGGNWVSARSVRHPGTKPRYWSVTMRKKRKKPLYNRIDKAVIRGLKLQRR